MGLNTEQTAKLKVVELILIFKVLIWLCHQLEYVLKYLFLQKASVKAKLIEIGQYIGKYTIFKLKSFLFLFKISKKQTNNKDDQLTDYVMIMVTNKKSEKQMAEDLELFLGGLSQASSFSAWLHSSIRSLSSASSSNGIYIYR